MHISVRIPTKLLRILHYENHSYLEALVHRNYLLSIGGGAKPSAARPSPAEVTLMEPTMSCGGKTAMDEGTRADVMALVGLLQVGEEETEFNAVAKSLLTDTSSSQHIRASLGELWAQNELLFQRRRQALQDFFGKHETLAPELQESARSSLVRSGAGDKRRLVEYLDDDEFLRRLKKKRRLKTRGAGGDDGNGGPQLSDLPDAILCQVYSLVPHKVCSHMAVSKRFHQCLPRAEKILLDIRKAEGKQVRILSASDVRCPVSDSRYVGPTGVTYALPVRGVADWSVRDPQTTTPKDILFNNVCTKRTPFCPASDCHLVTGAAGACWTR